MSLSKEAKYLLWLCRAARNAGVLSTIHRDYFDGISYAYYYAAIKYSKRMFGRTIKEFM